MPSTNPAVWQRQRIEKKTELVNQSAQSQEGKGTGEKQREQEEAAHLFLDANPQLTGQEAFWDHMQVHHPGCELRLSVQPSEQQWLAAVAARAAATAAAASSSS